MSLRDELLAIREARGRLTPQLVVEDARDETHPLHHRFEWDDAIAGEAYRYQQAAALIRSVEITRTRADGSKLRLRGFLAIRNDDTPASVYEPTEDVAADQFLTELMRREMRREWKTFKARYENFEEFWQMVRGDTTEQVA